MPNESETVDSGAIYALYAGEFKAQFTRIALEIDIFSPLARGPSDAGAVAKACQADVIGIRALLDYMTAIGILTHEAGKYGLTANAEMFLVRDRQSYAGDWLLLETDPVLWHNVLAAVKTGQHYPRQLPAAQDAWLESHSLWRMEHSLEMWAAIGVDPQKRAKLRVLDLACGCGIKTLVLARDSAATHITYVDSPDVLTVARQLAERLGVLAQASFRPGDLQTTALADESFDLAFLGQITYSLTESENIKLFAKLHRILAPGGLLVIDAIMRSEAPSELASAVTLLMHSLTGGEAHAAAEYEQWLQETGFGSITVHSEKWLSASKS